MGQGDPWLVVRSVEHLMPLEVNIWCVWLEHCGPQPGFKARHCSLRDIKPETSFAASVV